MPSGLLHVGADEENEMSFSSVLALAIEGL